MRSLSRCAMALIALPVPLAVTPAGSSPVEARETEELPRYLKDRGTGVPVSMFGTYVRKGELLVYPFTEWYSDGNFEYKPSEIGYEGGEDYRGRYTASEQLLFLGYGVGENLAVELEAAVISTELTKSSDPSAMPNEVEQYGLGDVEAQLRWRLQRENPGRPELFSYFETVFPTNKNPGLVGTPDWEYKLGFGAVRGYGFGTMTVRAAVEYTRAERKFEWGEYAIEYLRRLSPAWRVVGVVEGNQLDEVELITEVQWHFAPSIFLKANTGLGLTPNATDYAPELGVMFSF
ncbi:MAG: hypothetical protein ACREOU_02825 [Candidatus Eiseniibacteriota bacterium]